MTGWKRETKERVGMTSVLAINRSLFFVTNLWIMKTRARETDERWSKRMHTSPAQVLPSCYLFSLWLYFIYMVSFKLMLFLFFFHFYYPYIPSVMDWVQFLSKFFFSVSLLYFTWYLYIHLFGPLSNIFDKIEQNHGARLMSPLTVTVKPLSLQTSERHFSFLFFLVVKECVWLDSSKGIAEKEWNNTKKFVYKTW